MNDNLGFDTTVWWTSNDVSLSKENLHVSSPKIDDNEKFADAEFDDAEFGSAVQPTFADDDFGDFGEVINEGDAPPLQEDEVWVLNASGAAWQSLDISAGQSRSSLANRMYDLLGPLWTHIDSSHIMSSEVMRQLEGPNQILISAESRSLYHSLFQRSLISTGSTDWIRSRIRRRHLSSLGIPVNLDEVLPHFTGKSLPALHVTTRPSSAPPGSMKSSSVRGRSQNTVTSSRTGTPTPYVSSKTNLSQLALGPKPRVDEQKLSQMLNLTPDNLKLLPVATLRAHQQTIRSLTGTTSSVLSHLLQTRDALQQDSEAYNNLIAELVNEAQKAKNGGKNRAGSGNQKMAN